MSNLKEQIFEACEACFPNCENNRLDCIDDRMSDMRIGAHIGIALVLAEMEQGVSAIGHGTDPAAISLLNHIKQFTKGIDAK